MKRPKKPPFTPSHRTIWVADLLTLEGVRPKNRAGNHTCQVSETWQV